MHLILEYKKNFSFILFNGNEFFINRIIINEIDLKLIFIECYKCDNRVIIETTNKNKNKNNKIFFILDDIIKYLNLDKDKVIVNLEKFLIKYMS